MYRFSIIVPLLGEHNQFEDTLASVLRYRPHNTQIIVVHDGKYSDPYDLSDEIQLVEAEVGSNLISFVNIGMCYTAGEFTVMIRPGVELDENWDEPVEYAFLDDAIGSVTPIIVNNSRPSRILAAGVVADRTFSRRIAGLGRKWKSNRKCSLSPFGPTSWLAAYRTQFLKSVAPFDEQLDPMFLDLDIAMSFRNLGIKNELASEFLGFVESDDAILSESLTPHGMSAQRALRRFGEVHLTHTINNCFLELVQAPFVSGKLQHLFQRFGAGAMKNVDQQHSARLKMLSQSSNWRPTNSNHLNDSDTVDRRQAA